jgi:hypothetical protein
MVSVWMLKWKLRVLFARLGQLSGFALVAYGALGLIEAGRTASFAGADPTLRTEIFTAAAGMSIVALTAGMVLVWLSTRTASVPVAPAADGAD